MQVQEQYPNSESKVESGVFMGSMEPPVDSLPLSGMHIELKITFNIDLANWRRKKLPGPRLMKACK